MTCHAHRPQRPPREQLLEDALAKIAGKEQAVRPAGTERREEPQMRDGDILRLVDQDVIEMTVELVADPVGSDRCTEQFGSLADEIGEIEQALARLPRPTPAPSAQK